MDPSLVEHSLRVWSSVAVSASRFLRSNTGDLRTSHATCKRHSTTPAEQRQDGHSHMENSDHRPVVRLLTWCLVNASDIEEGTSIVRRQTNVKTCGEINPNNPKCTVPRKHCPSHRTAHSVLTNLGSHSYWMHSYTNYYTGFGTWRLYDAASFRAVNLLNQFTIPLADSSVAQPTKQCQNQFKHPKQKYRSRYVRSFSTSGLPRTAKPCSTPENTWMWYDAFSANKISSARRREVRGNIKSSSNGIMNQRHGNIFGAG